MFSRPTRERMEYGGIALARPGTGVDDEVAYLREQLRLTFDLAPIPKAVLRFDGCFDQVNDAMCELLGYAREELLNRTMPSISHPDDMGANLELQRKLLSGHIPSFHMDKRYLRADGQIVWVSLSVTMTWTMTGEPRMLGQLVDITERKQSEERLAHEAGHDHLTSLPNRRLMLHLIDRALAALPDDGRRAAAVLFCDVDQFKLYNDTFGHTMGDQLLVALAERLRSVLLGDETLGRFGGDELLVLCPSLRGAHGIEQRDEVEQARAAADRVRAALVEPLQVGERKCFVTVSTGIAMARSPSTTADALIRDADTAMYAAKRRGRDQVQLFDEALREATRERLDMESELRLAVDHHDLVAWFQPVVDLADGTLHGFEALARWSHGVRGMVPPDQFIPIAETTGLIGRLGEEMLDQALRMAQRCSVGHVAVNVSPAQLCHHAIVSTVGDALERNGVDPARLVIEVTEQAVIEDVDRAASLLGELRGLGLRVFIDDFGVGHSSLTQLTRLPIDGVKIDRSFVQDLDDRRLAVVETVVDLARRLGLGVVAEGVETPEQAWTLLGTGCTLAQGFRYAPALAPEAALEVASVGRVEPGVPERA